MMVGATWLAGIRSGRAVPAAAAALWPDEIIQRRVDKSVGMARKGAPRLLGPVFWLSLL